MIIDNGEIHLCDNKNCDNIASFTIQIGVTNYHFCRECADIIEKNM